MTIHLWLDDERAPGVLPQYQRPPYVGIEWTWVKTVPAFKEAVSQYGIENIGYVALDHDLGVCRDCERRMDGIREQSNGDPGVVWSAQKALRDEVLIRETGKGSYSSCVHNGDGSELVKWMRETGMWPKIKPRVHSFNPDGASRMRAVIDYAYERMPA